MPIGEVFDIREESSAPYYLQREFLSQSDYEHQTKSATAQALASLKASSEFQKFRSAPSAKFAKEADGDSEIFVDAYFSKSAEQQVGSECTSFAQSSGANFVRAFVPTRAKS